MFRNKSFIVRMTSDEIMRLDSKVKWLREVMDAERRQNSLQ